MKKNEGARGPRRYIVSEKGKGALPQTAYYIPKRGPGVYRLADVRTELESKWKVEQSEPRRRP